MNDKKNGVMGNWKKRMWKRYANTTFFESEENMKDKILTRMKELFWFPGVIIFGCTLGWIAICIFIVSLLK